MQEKDHFETLLKNYIERFEAKLQEWDGDFFCGLVEGLRIALFLHAEKEENEFLEQKI